MSPRDKTIIEDGVFHSQNKFDNVEEYVKKDQIDEYKEALSKEVRNHLAEEICDFEGIDEDDNILAFIKFRVNSIVNSQVIL